MLHRRYERKTFNHLSSSNETLKTIQHFDFIQNSLFCRKLLCIVLVKSCCEELATIFHENSSKKFN